MDVSIDHKDGAPTFGAKGCFRLIVTLVAAYILAVLLVSGVLNVFQGSEFFNASQSLSVEDVKIAGKIINSFLIPFLLVAVAIFVLKKYLPDASTRYLLLEYGFRRSPPGVSLIASFIVGLSLILLHKQLMDVFPRGPSVEELPSAIVSKAEFWAQMFFAINLCTVVPVSEEFVFRGVLYKGFSLSYGKLVAAIAVSTLFTLGHVDALNAGYWLDQTTLSIFPLVLVLARELTGSLHSPVLVHAGFNFGSIFIT